MTQFTLVRYRTTYSGYKLVAHAKHFYITMRKITALSFTLFYYEFRQSDFRGDVCIEILYCTQRKYIFC